jgi:hypothetical protein
LAITGAQGRGGQEKHASEERQFLARWGLGGGAGQEPAALAEAGRGLFSGQSSEPKRVEAGDVRPEKGTRGEEWVTPGFLGVVDDRVLRASN